jgi:hypothetical protein
MFKWDVIVWPHTHTHTRARARHGTVCTHTTWLSDGRCVCVCVHNNNNEIFEAAESLCNGRARIHTIFVHTQIALYPRSWGCLQPDLIAGGSIILWYTQPETRTWLAVILLLLLHRSCIFSFSLSFSLSLSPLIYFGIYTYIIYKPRRRRGMWWGT